MLDLETLKYDAQGLVPAIIQDAFTKKVLMLAYMNKQSLEISIQTGFTCFYSRSRQELWKKGVYSESGMGCTGPIVLVSDDEANKAKEILSATGFMS